MRRRFLNPHLLLLFFLLPGTVAAEEFVNYSTNEAVRLQAGKKPVLVVEFGEASAEGSKFSDALAQGKKEFEALESVAVADERALPDLLERKADSVGMVVLIHPRDMETVSRLPGLYPDVAFTLIDSPTPSFATNVQAVQFKEEDGMFLLGAIAAIRSDGRISIMAMDEAHRSKRMAKRFSDGARHIRQDSELVSRLGVRPTSEHRTRLASTLATEFQSGTAIVFVVDEEMVEPALRAAKPERKLVIAPTAPAHGLEASRLLTHLVKRYDLALLDVLRIYQHNQWYAGTIELGLPGGYVDYSLNADNVDIFPKDSIDRIEALKDYLGQGVMKQ